MRLEAGILKTGNEVVFFAEELSAYDITIDMRILMIGVEVRHTQDSNQRWYESRP
jgi:hypothetical protein